MQGLLHIRAVHAPDDAPRSCRPWGASWRAGNMCGPSSIPRRISLSFVLGYLAHGETTRHILRAFPCGCRRWRLFSRVRRVHAGNQFRCVPTCASAPRTAWPWCDPTSIAIQPTGNTGARSTQPGRDDCTSWALTRQRRTKRLMPAQRGRQVSALRGADRVAMRPMLGHHGRARLHLRGDGRVRTGGLYRRRSMALKTSGRRSR